MIFKILNKIYNSCESDLINLSGRVARDSKQFYQDFYSESSYSEDFIRKSYDFIRVIFTEMALLTPEDSLKKIEAFLVPIDTDFDYLLMALGKKLDDAGIPDEKFFSVLKKVETVDDVIRTLSITES